VTQDIWGSMPVPEQKRFLRHLRAYWEVHRHRIAPEQGQIIANLIAEGRLRLYGGRIVRYLELDSVVEVTLRDRRNGRELALQVDRIINCTGSETDCRRIDDPLITNLFALGFARPDAVSLGLDVDENGTVLERTGKVSDFFYAIGPVRKGCLWETTAVPEIRGQASQLADHLVKNLQSP
jgi:uncharacterized NAD(P)/FAD-binding protein YdhS